MVLAVLGELCSEYHSNVKCFRVRKYLGNLGLAFCKSPRITHSLKTLLDLRN